MNAANRSCIMSWEDLTVQNFREAFLKFLSGYIATLYKLYDLLKAVNFVISVLHSSFCGIRVQKVGF
jgi:hypothetical protein